MRIAIIGTGRMGRRHVEAASRLGFPVVALADIDADAAARAARDFNLTTAACGADAPALLAATKPDCVIVATTAPSHAEYACLAAEAGAAKVLCEKPLAVSLAECARIRETCDRHGAALAVNHPMRYMEQYTKPRALLAGPACGGLASITVVAGNMGLAMNGTHYVEMFRFMTGEPPATVTAWLAPDRVPNPRGPQFSDRGGQIRVTTATGKRLYLDAGPDQGHGLHVVYAARHARIEVDELAGTLRVCAREPGDRDLPTTRFATAAAETVQTIAPADVVAATQSVLGALASGGDYPDGQAGELAVATLVAAYVSDENGHAAVDVDVHALPQVRVFPWA